MLYALLDRDDIGHERSAALLRDGIAGRALVTHRYVVVEAIMLLQRRLGLAAVRDLDTLLGGIAVEDVKTELHDRAMAAMLTAGRRSVSFVDWTSFLFMRDKGIRTALTLDGDFADQGFEVLPA